MDAKKCSKCGEKKTLSEFYKSTRGGCKACIRAYHRQWYQENKAVEKEKLPEGKRRCGDCREIKSTNQFYRDKSNASGFHHYCKTCSNRRKKEQIDRKKAMFCGPVIPGHLKQCSTCKQILPRSEFYKSSSSSDGLRYKCKDCERAYKQSKAGRKSARKYEGKPEVRKRRNVQRREQRAEGKAEWVVNEKEYRKEYRQRDYVKEKHQERIEEYREHPENREKARQVSKEWRKENPEKLREQGRIKYLRKKGADGEHSLEQWNELVELCGGKCLACGGNGELTRDHIEPLIKGGSDEITNIQPLCRKCNSEKHIQGTDYRSQHIREWAAEQMEVA